LLHPTFEKGWSKSAVGGLRGPEGNPREKWISQKWTHGSILIYGVSLTCFKHILYNDYAAKLTFKGWGFIAKFGHINIFTVHCIIQVYGRLDYTIH